MQTSKRLTEREDDYLGWDENGAVFSAPEGLAVVGLLAGTRATDTIWFPGADLSRRATTDGGSILGGKPKCLWHDTETDGVPGYETGFFPNMTIMGQKPYQHIPADRAARALKNLDGGVQTNRWNCFQVEVVGWVNKVTYQSIMTDLAQWLEEARGCPRVCTVEFIPYDSSFGASRVRMTDAQWLDYAGHCGHMHAAENVHGDPGSPFPMAQILAGGDDVGTVDGFSQTALDQMTRAIELKLNTLATGAGQLSFGNTVKAILSGIQGLKVEGDQDAGAVQAQITDLKSATLGAIAALPPPNDIDDVTPEDIADLAEKLKAAGVGGITGEELLALLKAHPFVPA